MEKITINKEDQRFIFNSGKYISCLGFDVLEKRLTSLAKELNYIPQSKRKGTIKRYNEYQSLLSIARKKNHETGWRSTSELTPEFIGHEGKRVEVVTSYGETQRYYIGKSAGFIPCHLQILKSNSSGGMSVIGHPFKSIRFLN